MRNARVLAASLLLAAGCGAPIEGSTPIALDKLPAGVLDRARKERPGVTFDSARKATYKGQDSIEIRGKDRQGKIHEVRVDPSGKLLEIE